MQHQIQNLILASLFSIGTALAAIPAAAESNVSGGENLGPDLPTYNFMTGATSGSSSIAAVRRPGSSAHASANIHHRTATHTKRLSKNASSMKTGSQAGY